MTTTSPGDSSRATRRCCSASPAIQKRLRDVAERVGITERAAQRIVADLVESGYVERTRIGRRNHYTINPAAEMRHEAQSGHEIGALLECCGSPLAEQAD